MGKTSTEETGTKESDWLWEQIQNLPLELYGLPGQVVHNHVKRSQITDDAVHLKLKSTAVLPALEEALQKVALGERQTIEITHTSEFVVLRREQEEL